MVYCQGVLLYSCYVHTFNQPQPLSEKYRTDVSSVCVDGRLVPTYRTANTTTSERSNVCSKVQPIEFTTSERSNVCSKVQPIEFTTSERSNVSLVVITLTIDAQYVSAVSIDGQFKELPGRGNYLPLFHNDNPLANNSSSLIP